MGRIVRLAAAAALLAAAPRGAQAARPHVWVAKVVTGRHVLVAGRDNVVTARPGLAFAADVRSAGPLRLLRVTLTLTPSLGGAAPVVRTAALALASGTHATVRFGDLGRLPFAQRVLLKVTVTDGRTALWTRTYPVLFTLG